MGGFCGVVRAHSYNFDFRWIKILNFEKAFWDGFASSLDWGIFSRG